MINEILTGISPYIWQILGVILTTIVGYVGVKVKALYEKKINTELKREIVKTVVEMIEQVAKSQGWDGEKKLEEARKTILEMINRSGLKITELELHILIEAVVNSFNKTK